MLDQVKRSRYRSYLAIAVVYVIAVFAGLWVYNALTLGIWLDLLLADVAATVVVFVFSLVFDNASVYDPYWSVQPIVIVAGLASQTHMTPLRLLILLCICFWGIRLTANWAYTFHGLTHQDWRYTMLRGKTGRFYPVINFTGIHLVPTLIVYGCTLPAAYAFTADLGWKSLSAMFIGLSFCAAVMQGRADLQMHRFRKRSTGGFIREGLWKHSRHPNYLGEILMWWGIALSVTAAAPRLWYLCAGAAANTLLFLFVSIPMADKRQSQKPGFEEYKSQTRMLLPVGR